MATILLGYQGTISISVGGSPSTGAAASPTVANCRNVVSHYSKPLVDITALGASVRTYKHSIPDGGFITFDIMVDGDAATPPLPYAPATGESTTYTLTVQLVSGKSYAGLIKIQSHTLLGVSMDGNPRQIARYRAVWNGAVTVT